MKKIYIVLTHTGTVLSTIIRYYTKDSFSHVSIALDEELQKMYSFGRLNAYNPFWGGFVHEEINKGTFKRFKNTKAEVYSLKIEDEEYEKLTRVIKHFEENKEKYKFNTLGLACVCIKKQIKLKNTFYCAEFVRHVLKMSGINLDNLPKIIKPLDFKKLENLQLEYEGILRNYKHKKLLKYQKVLD